MALEEAIKTAQPDRLRRTLSVLCRNLPDAAKSAAFQLLVSDDMVKVKSKRQVKAGLDGQRKKNGVSGEVSAKSLIEGPSEPETRDDDEDDDEDENQDDDDEDDEDESQDEDEEEEENEEAEEQRIAAKDKFNRKKDKGKEGGKGREKYAAVLNQQDIQEKESSHSATAILHGNKRLRAKYAVCSNCQEEYDVTQNHKKACRWHDGMNLCTKGGFS